MNDKLREQLLAIASDKVPPVNLGVANFIDFILFKYYLIPRDNVKEIIKIDKCTWGNLGSLCSNEKSCPCENKISKILILKG